MDAPALIARALVARPPHQRGPFLRDVLTQAAAGLVVIEGPETTLTTIYDLGDAIVLKGAEVALEPGRTR